MSIEKVSKPLCKVILELANNTPPVCTELYIEPLYTLFVVILARVQGRETIHASGARYSLLSSVEDIINSQCVDSNMCRCKQ